MKNINKELIHQKLNIKNYDDNLILKLFVNGFKDIDYQNLTYLIINNQSIEYYEKSLINFFETNDTILIIEFIKQYIKKLNSICFNFKLNKGKYLYNFMSTTLNLNFEQYFISKMFLNVFNEVDINFSFKYNYLFEIYCPQNTFIVKTEKGYILPLCSIFKIKEITEIENMYFISMYVCYQSKYINYEKSDDYLIKKYKNDFINLEFDISENFYKKIKLYSKYIKSKKEIFKLNIFEPKYNFEIFYLTYPELIKNKNINDYKNKIVKSQFNNFYNFYKNRKQIRFTFYCDTNEFTKLKTKKYFNVMFFDELKCKSLIETNKYKIFENEKLDKNIYKISVNTKNILITKNENTFTVFILSDFELITKKEEVIKTKCDLSHFNKNLISIKLKNI